MANHQRLEQALVEFAHLLVDEFAVEDVIQRLCAQALTVVSAFGAGVAVHDPNAVRVLATVGVHAPELEDLQVTLGEGPCRDAVASSEVVQAQFYEFGYQRWPQYSRSAYRLGVRTVVAVPMRAGDRPIGSLDVYSKDLDLFTADDLAALQALADAAAAYVLNAWNRTQREVAESRMRYQVLHDALTELPNRLLFADRLSHAVAALHRRASEIGVLFIDLDRFKQVNDVHGHSVGDRLLVAVARRLQSVLRLSDTLCRFGGDEFLVLCEDLRPGMNDLELVAHRLIAALDQPFKLPEGDLVVRCSIGAVLATNNDTWDTLLRDADQAMYVAKKLGGGVSLSERDAPAAMAEAIRTEAELRQAIERDEIRAFFQPVVALKSGAVAGFEALARWAHPRRGMLSAEAFIPLAEVTGLIVPLGQSIFEQVHQVLLESQYGRFAEAYIAVNLSGRELRSPEIVGRIKRTFAGSTANLERIILEVTETSLIREGEGLDELQELADLGLKIAIDDFGTGYSTLAYLAELPADVVKIDHAFVSRIGQGTKDEALIRSMIVMAHELDLVVVAEGVETAVQHEFVLSCDCDFGQGWYYGGVSPSLEPAT